MGNGEGKLVGAGLKRKRVGEMFIFSLKIHICRLKICICKLKIYIFRLKIEILSELFTFLLGETEFGLGEGK